MKRLQRECETKPEYHGSLKRVQPASFACAVDFKWADYFFVTIMNGASKGDCSKRELANTMGIDFVRSCRLAVHLNAARIKLFKIVKANREVTLIRLHSRGETIVRNSC